MNIINLLPLHHRLRLQHQRLVRRWAAGLGLYTALMVAAAIVTHELYSIDDHSILPEIQQLQAETAQIEKAHHATLAQFAKVDAEAQLRELVNTPPDFATLLSVVSRGCDDDAILTSLKWELTSDNDGRQTVGPADAAGAKAVDPLSGPMQIKLQMTGLSRAQTGVGTLVQHLQTSGLFDEVRLIKTSREGFLNGDALAFQLSCDIHVPGRRGGSVQP